MSQTRLLAASAAFVATASTLAAATTYTVALVPAQSNLNTSTTVSAPIAGTFIGNYDATTNPGGTQTRPGLFGGSGNNPINYAASLGAGGDVASHPTGGFTLVVDQSLLTFSISGLVVNMLGSTSGSIDTTITINYDSFHTVAPNAIFPGGFTVPIPLGAGSIDELNASQTGAAIGGVLVPQGKGVYQFVAAVPVDLLATFTFNGQVFGGTPIPFVLPLTGTIDFSGENVTLSLSGEQTFSQQQPIDPPVAFTDQALDLPTVLPPGGTAHLLFSGSTNSISADADISFNLFADALPVYTPGDLNGDGVVGPADLAILLGAWGTPGPGDLNGDGVVGPQDLALLLGNWS